MYIEVYSGDDLFDLSMYKWGNERGKPTTYWYIFYCSGFESRTKKWKFSRREYKKVESFTVDVRRCTIFENLCGSKLGNRT